MLNKKENIKLIEKAYKAIDNVLAVVRFGEYGKQYYSLNNQEEKQHDLRRSQDTKRGLSIAVATKLFYVRQIVEALHNILTVSAKDYIFVRKSVFFAQSLAHHYNKALTQALQGFNYDDILALDYADLVKP